MFTNPNHRYFRNMIDTYYDSPVMQKIRNSNNKSIFMCRIASLLLKEKRYLIAICPVDNSDIDSLSPLKDLTWEIFQTRCLDNEEYTNKDIIKQAYNSKRNPHIELHRTSKNSEYSIYKPIDTKHNIEITLLNTTQDEYEYPENGSIIACLETFQTIIRCL